MIQTNIFKKNNLFQLILILSLIFIANSAKIQSNQFFSYSPEQDLKAEIQKLMKQRSLKGIQMEINKKGIPIYYQNQGVKNQFSQLIDTNTLFRIASLSKSFSSVSIMQLVQKGKLKLTDSLSSILGYSVVNPNFPNINITVQMILSHQSSIAQTDVQYNNFLMEAYNAPDGYKVPDLKQILVPGGKYYNPKMFMNKQPGEYHHYSNLGYVIAGTIVQKISNIRFDIFQQQNVLNSYNKYFNYTSNATYNIGKIQDLKNLATLYIGNQGKWVPDCDNYGKGTINQRNLTGYTIGKNGAVFGPQGGLRASVHHLNLHMYMISNGGVLPNGQRVLSQQSIAEILKPRYNYHGSSGGQLMDDHLYGLGLFTTSYLPYNIVISHEVVRGHTGSAYGLASGYFFFKDYTFSYIINGALYGYNYNTGTIFSEERMRIHSAVDKYLQTTQKQTQSKAQIEAIAQQFY